MRPHLNPTGLIRWILALHPEVPLRKTIIRYLAMAIGVVPVFAVLIYQYVVSSGRADAMFTANSFWWFICAGAFSVLWIVVLVFQIATKQDPIYDRLAGTAVVRKLKR